MAVFGLTTTGLVIMSLPEIRDMINARIWRDISPTLDLSDRSLEGTLVGIVAEALHKMWEMAERLNSAFDPDKAVDAFLDAICLITGTFRRGASKSAVTLTLTGTPTTLVPEESGVRVAGETRFNTTADATIIAVDEWVILTTYAIGDWVTHLGNVYQALNTGTSGNGFGTDPRHTARGSSDDPTTYYVDLGNPELTPVVIPTDGDIDWLWLGAGTGAIGDVGALATVTGPIIANAWLLNEIVTPVGGWEGVFNYASAVAGRDQMTNPELRVLRQLELAQPGTGPLDAIRSALLNIGEIGTATRPTAVTVFQNVGDVTDDDGIPPHSVEALVTGGEDQTIWDCLRVNVVAGIRTHGEEEGFSTDSQGIAQPEAFTRPEEVLVYITIDLIKDPENYPLDGDDQVAAAVVALGNESSNGRNVVSSYLGKAAFITGVNELTSVFISTSVSPTLPTTIPISLRQLARYAVARVVVNSVDGVP